MLLKTPPEPAPRAHGGPRRRVVAIERSEASGGRRAFRSGGRDWRQQRRGAERRSGDDVARAIGGWRLTVRLRGS